MAAESEPREEFFQLIREAFNKISQIILQSRIIFSQNIHMKKNEWFHLEIKDFDVISRQLILVGNKIYLPLRIQIFSEELTASETTNANVNILNNASSNQKDNQTLAVLKQSTRVLLEEWKISFEPRLFNQDANSLSLPTLNKRLVVLIRSIYSYVRILPAYKLFRDRIKNKMAPYQLNYRLIHSDREEEMLETHEFGSNPEAFNFEEIKTPFGIFRVVVKYCSQPPVNLKSDMKQIVVDNYEPQKLQRHQSAPAKTNTNDTLPSQFSSPLLSSNTTKPTPAPTTPNSTIKSNPIPIQSSIVATGNTGIAVAAQSAPTSVHLPHPGRNRTPSLSGSDNKGSNSVSLHSPSSRLSEGCNSQPPPLSTSTTAAATTTTTVNANTTGIPIPTTAPRSTRSSSRGASLGPLLDLSSDASPAFSTLPLSTSGGDKSSTNPFLRACSDSTTNPSKGTSNTSLLSSTPPLTIGSPPSSFSIFKPFKSPRFSSNSGEKYTPFQLSISPFRDSPLATMTDSSSTPSSSRSVDMNQPTATHHPSPLFNPQRHQTVQIYPTLSPTSPTNNQNLATVPHQVSEPSNPTNLPVTPTAIQPLKLDNRVSEDNFPLFVEEHLEDNKNLNMLFELEDIAAFAIDCKIKNPEIAQFIQDCQTAPSLSFQTKHTLSSQVTEFEKLKDLTFLEQKAL